MSGKAGEAVQGVKSCYRLRKINNCTATLRRSLDYPDVNGGKDFGQAIN